jgi:type II secretory pathway component PulJ
MKLTPTCIRRRPTAAPGFTLIECLVYISLVFVILGLATAAFYRCFDNMKALRRNTDDITQALHAGELWRADIRAATRPVQFDPTDQLLRISHPNGEVSYKFADAQVLRRTGADASWVVVLPKVENSQMQSDSRGQVAAWRWELELKSLRKPATMRPLFTFTAVPNVTGTP